MKDKQQTRCPYCGHRHNWRKKDDITNSICQFFSTKSYRKCDICEELFNQEDNEIKEVNETNSKKNT